MVQRSLLTIRGVAIQRNGQRDIWNKSCIHSHNHFVSAVVFYVVAALQYASLFFIVGVGVDSDDENELGVLEFIHCLVETLDKVRLQSLAHQRVRLSGEKNVVS